jgi:mono/diheme cytochrome c family protein
MRVLALPAALVVVALVAGCGRGGKADLVNGKTLFVQKCGSCHTLARAGTKGIQGPNLDAAFTEARQQGFGESSIKGVVFNQISHVRRGSIMPLNLVKGDNARDVAAYVGSAAAKPGKDSGALASAGQPKTSSKPAVEQNGQLNIPADPTGALAFKFSKANAKAGQVSLVMPNQAPIKHDISIKGNGVNQQGPEVGKGGTSKVSVNLKPGTYTFYCSVPGHEAGGMKGTLTVK